MDNFRSRSPRDNRIRQAIMQLGKHNGTPLCDISTQDLTGLVGQSWLGRWLKLRIIAELEWRLDRPGDRPAIHVGEIVGAVMAFVAGRRPVGTEDSL